MRRVAFHTLGCKLNFAETSAIARSLSGDLFEKVSPDETADIHIINTCSVTDTADKKCRQLIKHLVNKDPGAFIVVVGCYAQLNPEKISTIKGVDLILGSNEKFDLAKHLSSIEKKKSPEILSCGLSHNDNFREAWSAGDRTRSFLKVQDGCDYKCSYCTIPMARGDSRNPTIESIVREAETIAAAGIKEIVITGVNIGDFGKSTGDNFYGLLLKLVDIPGIERYRISSIEPNLLTDEILELAANNPKILPHFHIPLQNGNNKILGLMRRRYKRELFAKRIYKIKELLPLAGIGADVIVGFPGEGEAEFMDTYTFLESLPLSYLHVFPFSERPGTVAAGLTDKVPYKEKERRCKELIQLSGTKHSAFIDQNIGRSEQVLFESTETKGMISGFSTNYLRVEVPWDHDLVGQIKNVKLVSPLKSGRISGKIL